MEHGNRPPPERRRSWWRRASSYLLLALFFVCTTLQVERSTAPASAPAGPRTAPQHEGSRRAFVLVIDSLRWQTAMDPALMPNLAHVRERAAFGRVSSTTDAVTHPALRAAFSGRLHPPLLPLLANVARGRPRLDSILDQADAAGLAVATMSDGSLDQFAIGTALPQHEGTSEYEQDLQDSATRSALARFVRGDFDLVVAHVTYSDHAAHAHGILAPEYRAVFQRIDELVGEIDAAIASEDTLAVMGDHGHDDKGNHGPGLEVPTTLLYRGPGFRQGFDVGDLSITDNRYFMGFALQLPLAPAYQGQTHPRALAVSVLPTAYREPAARPRPLRTAGVLCFAVHLALFVLVWSLHAEQKRRRTVLSAWLVALPAALVGAAPYNSLLGILLAAIWLVRHQPGVRIVRLSLLALVAVCALVAWGYGLGQLRETVHEPTAILLERVALLAAVLGLVISWLAGAELAAWIVGGATLVLAYPTVYRYGAFGALAPLWGMLLLFSTVPDLRRWLLLERTRSSERLQARLSLALRLSLGAAAYALVVPFLHSESRQFTFEAWSGRFTPNSPLGWGLLAMVGKLIVFAPAQPWTRSSLTPALAGLTLVAAFMLVDSGVLPLVGGVGLGAVAILLVLWLAARRTNHQLERALFLGMVYALARLTLRLPSVQWAWADAFFAATVLSAAALRRATDAPTRRWGGRCLLLLGVVASGWVTLAWTVHRVEWTFVGDWLPASFAQTHLLWFGPLLAVRYLLPGWVMLRLVQDALGGEVVDDWLRDVAGLKLLATTAVGLGLAWFSADSDVYVESLQQNAFWLLLIAGLFIPPAARGQAARAVGASPPAGERDTGSSLPASGLVA